MEAKIHSNWQNDPEGKHLFVMADVLSGLAYCGCHQDPYMFPVQLDVVLRKWEELIRPRFGVLVSATEPKMTMGEFDYKDLEEMAEELHQIPEFKNWNLSRAEAAKGIEVNDPSRPPFVFSSRYGGPPQDEDCIDLDALTHNLCHFLWQHAEMRHAEMHQTNPDEELRSVTRTGSVSRKVVIVGGDDDCSDE